MKLKALRVHGFKSFADSTEIEFHEGITAIVGPNGCGKSNIGDAIRWVLGEQRPSAIRGAKMEEAIFQGSVHRRPVNRGSVVLRVSNEDGSLPVPFEEVEIGRTVYRDGGSEYSINRTSCRLKDVVEMCRDTGLGADAYSVIENRMIDVILSDRAEERRSLFEEAAGIGKYKDRRKTAVRRLERAEIDLQRLDDVIAEVETKVRSLARQKGRAQRYQELRSRRLSVEVFVVRRRLEELTARLSEVEAALAGDVGESRGAEAELRTAEAELETLRLRQVDVERARQAAGAEVDRIRSELVRWERDVAVAEQSARGASDRLARIEGERVEASARLGSAEEEIAAIADERGSLEARLEEASATLERRRVEARSVRERLQGARELLAGLEAREREIARRTAQLEGDAEGAQAQGAELERRVRQLEAELEDAASALSEMDAQGDLFSDRLSRLGETASEAAREVEARQRELTVTREALEAARRSELESQDRASDLAARREALEAMVRDGEGAEPVVRALIEASVEGVLGRLVDFMEVDQETAPVVEAYLGSLGHGVVVRDSGAVRAALRWYGEEWEGGAGLVLLPLDRVPKPTPAPAPTLLDLVEARGAGAPWVRALLEPAAYRPEEGLDGVEPAGGTVVASGGAWIDSLGVIRVGNPAGGAGLLERRALAERLAGEAEEAASEAARARETREAAQRAVSEAEAALESARDRLREAREELGSAEAEAARETDRRTRLDRHRDELIRQLEGTKAARLRVLERAREARATREALIEEDEGIEERRSEARAEVAEAEAAWEEVQAAESRLAVEHAHLEGEVRRMRERSEDLERQREGARIRLEALDREEETLRAQLEEAEGVRAEGAERTAALFSEREGAEAELRARDEALAEVGEQIREVEARVRKARQAERDATERRHRLELERQELDGRIGRIRERLEGEWGRPLESLLEEVEPLDDTEADLDSLAEELQEIVRALDRLGPVNMLAVEEHEEESRRLDFLREQRDDLLRARDDLRAAIREINQTATSLFHETFERIRENFRETFLRLFQGGEADLWLTDPEDPLESPIEIHASPRGKKTQRIDLLSGGERALTALSLLFGIYLVKPSPFCVLDEVDAPLDEANIGRFIQLLQEFKDDSQFVVITHNPRTIEAADWIYGVTMEEPGVSSVVGVRLEEALDAAGSAA